MGKYRITDNESGRTLVVEGDSPPTEEDVKILFDYGRQSQNPGPTQTRSGYLNTERGNLSARAEELGVTGLFEPRPADEMSEGEQRGMGALKMLQDYGLGASQLAAHILPNADTSKIDALMADRERAYQTGGLADKPAAGQGMVLGGILGAGGPGGLGVKAAGAMRVPAMLAPFVEGGLAGGLEAASMPVAGDNYWGGKGEQVMWGAGIGAGANAGMQALLRGGTGVANMPGRALNAPSDMVTAATLGNRPIAARGSQAAARHGVDLTPGQATGSQPLRFAEQRARESFFSSAKVAEGDLIRANQLNEAIKRVAGDSTTPVTGRELQNRTRGYFENLFKQRSEHGRTMYGEIDRFAGNQRIVKPTNLYKELEAIIKEAGTQEGGDVVSAAAQARKMMDTIDQQVLKAKESGGNMRSVGYTAQEALGRLQNYSSKATTVFDNVSRGYDKVLKRRVYDALMRDMDAAGTTSGTLGDMVKQANATWRGFSEQIDSMKNSVFGKMMGRDAGQGAVTPNSVSPAQVIKRLTTMDYSEANDIMRFMDENMSDMSTKVRGSILNDAINAGAMGPPSGGADFVFNPNQFLSALGLKAGTAGAEGMKRLEAIFGAGTPEWKSVQELIDLSQRMGDVYGKNFSGTGPTVAFMGWLKDFATLGAGTLKRIGSTGLEIAGLRRIADSMTPGNINFGNLQPRPLIQPPRITNQASRAAGVIAPVFANDQ